MGATLSLCWFAPEWMYFAHIGDSRIYHLSKAGELRQLSHDHSYVGWLRRKGELNERQARSHADNIHTAERRMQSVVQRQGELWKKLAAIHINANLELPPSVRKSMDGRHDKIEAQKVEIERIKTNLSSLKRLRASTAETRANQVAALDAAHHANAPPGHSPLETRRRGAHQTVQR